MQAVLRDATLLVGLRAEAQGASRHQRDNSGLNTHTVLGCLTCAMVHAIQREIAEEYREIVQ